MAKYVPQELAVSVRGPIQTGTTPAWAVVVVHVQSKTDILVFVYDKESEANAAAPLLVQVIGTSLLLEIP